jgi:hypothetical protein
MVPGIVVTGVADGSKARRATCSTPCCVMRNTRSSNIDAPVATSGPAASVSSEMPPVSVGTGIAYAPWLTPVLRSITWRLGAKPVISTLWPVTTGPPAGRNDSSCRHAWAPLPILNARTDWSSITAMTRSSSTARPIAAPWMRNRQRTRPFAESRA